MGFWSRLLGREQKAALTTLPDFLTGSPVRSGVAVNWRTALEVTTVLAAARVISQGIAQVPVRFYNGANDRLDRVKDHPLEPVLCRRPNRWQTPYALRQTMIAHALLTGNAFAFVNKVGPSTARRVVEIVPIEPGRVTVHRRADLSLDYHVAAESPGPASLTGGPFPASSGQVQVFPQDSIWHLRGPSWNSWVGLEPVRFAREAIGLGIATEAAHARFHANSAKAGGLYAVEGKLSEDQYTKLAAWLEKHLSGDAAYRPLILDNNAKFTSTTMTGVDAEHLATRKFQVEEICRALGVNPLMVYSSDKTATYASAEQMFIAHVVHTLAPWATNWEESARLALIADDDQTYLRLNLNGLMRGASKDRGAFYSQALGHGGGHAWMTPNEVREDDGLDWIEGGDTLPAPSPTAEVAPDKEDAANAVTEDDPANAGAD